MKVLMIPSFFKNEKNKFSGSFFLEQAIALAESGNEVVILYPDVYSIKHIKDFLFYKEKSETIKGVDVYRGRNFAPLKHEGFLFSERSFVNTCKKLARKVYKKGFSFQIIHAQNCVWAGSAALKLSTIYNVPYVITEHSSMYDLMPKKTIRKIYPKIERILKNSSGNACVSTKLKQAISRFDKNVIVIGNIVDTKNYELIKREKEPQKKFVFISIALLTSENRLDSKGISLLLRGFARHLKAFPNSVLKIVGVSSNTKLNYEIKGMNLENNVNIIGQLRKDELQKEMQTSHCFILPSKYETFGLVYAEAMSTGLPVISTDVGIASEVINSRTGILCHERNPESIAKAMTTVLTNYSQYDGKYIRDTIVKPYSKENICLQIERFYQKAVYINDNF